VEAYLLEKSIKMTAGVILFHCFPDEAYY